MSMETGVVRVGEGEASSTEDFFRIDGCLVGDGEGGGDVRPAVSSEVTLRVGLLLLLL